MKPIPEEQPTLFETAKQLDDAPLFTKPDEDEFACPVLVESKQTAPFVDCEYCESFASGEGCKYIESCEAYKNNKNETNTK